MAESIEEDDSAYIIKDGDYVVLKRGDIYKAVQIQIKKKVMFEKQWLFLEKAVGQLYSTAFEVVSGGHLEPQKAKTTESSTDAQEAGSDNRNIVDDGKSQKLTRDDIETLKEQGLKGQEIIQQLIDNSSTFRDKTEFSQQKYIKKKKKKYESTITVLRPSCRILAMMYHGREPGKICHLRYDTLAQMLTLGNIHAGGKVLVFETCAGLVLGAVMERMGGYGKVVQMYPGDGPVQAGLESFGFPPHFHDTLHTFPIGHVNALLAGTLDTGPPKELAAESSDASVPSKEGEEAGRTNADTGGDGGGEGEGKPEEVKMETSTPAEVEQNEREKLKAIRLQEKQDRMEVKRKKLAVAAALLEGKNADGLIIASRFHPSPVLLGLIKFLAPSRPFVVYSQYKEPLIECYTKLKENSNKEHCAVINLQLTDSWLRHYQVLPNRTHPVLQMSGGGGYLLSGTTVDMQYAKAASSQQAVEQPPAKKLKLTGSEG
ncbi:tRNA (adenine(58)-N(1))-methyltransferase non-catalytic subunit TRM6 [Gadus macrocephalus]|uniref:tRNA (adenine(58)-N(1))-methyltransferase non-catalytic subunit TRM6 n=1 Tax=Gadus macrocephalus TaxID=80720 RepID=UPI0028CBB6C8|nr:tRNA (adenine(58)-N(1))-methyltransferase non-catalytic subunit TRM6 [Gadus macrocephalus]